MGDPRPIGFFDSGVGGLTVLVEVMRRLPREDTIYLGDNARTPYGPRPDDEVVRFSTECLDALAERDVKAIVVACNTSTAIALPILRRRYALPILGVVRPGATAAALATRTRAVGLIATQATVRSHAYFEAIKEEDPFVEVYEHATPELVPLVEAGRLSGPDVEVVLRRALAPLLGSQALGDGARDESFIFPMPSDARIDTLLLGCTHYPLLGPVIRGLVGDDIAVIDFGIGHGQRPGQPDRGPRARCARPPPGTPSHAHDRRCGSLPRHGAPPVRGGVRDRGDA